MPALNSLFILIILLLCSSHISGQAPPALTEADHDSIHTADTLIPTRYLTGHFDPAEDSLFVMISTQYAVRPGMYLHKDVYDAFIKMYHAARNDGIRLVIVSATRNFAYQRRLWTRKWTGIRKVHGHNLVTHLPDPVKRAREILKYTAMPGTSRHHWGTDIDIKSVNKDYFLTDKGKKVYAWLSAHAAQYGFCQVYSRKDSLRPCGYEEEKWHWSYMPLAKRYLESYLRRVDYDDISGFGGSGTARQLEVIQRFVSAINPSCDTLHTDD